MPLAVLIIAGENGDSAATDVPAMLPVAGQTLLEYQVRLARAVGGGHIVVLVDQLPAAMVALFDRLRADGIDVDVARDARDAADRIHPDEHVLLFTQGLIVPRRLLADLVARNNPTLLTLAGGNDNAGFERIDAAEHWAGAALLSGQTLRETAAMLGDWSIGSTLMRNALRSGAARWRPENSKGLVVVANTDQARAASAALVQDCDDDDAPFFDRYVLQPLARLIVPYGLRAAVPVDLVAVLPIILAGAALLLALLGWFATAFALLFLSGLARAVARLMLSVAVRESGALTVLERIKLPILCGCLLVLGWQGSGPTGDWTGVLLAAWIIAGFLLHRPQVRPISLLSVPTIESSACVLIFALLFGVPLAGLIVLVVHRFAFDVMRRFFNE